MVPKLNRPFKLTDGYIHLKLEPMLWTPSQSFIEATNVWRFMQRLGFSDREAFLRFSREQPERFWDELVRELGIEWFHPYDEVLDASRGPEWTTWFTGGTLNIAHNCLDRWAATDRTACIWEAENGATRTLTFREVHAEANRVANGLRALGLEPGDRVALCLPMLPEILPILYGCFKAGTARRAHLRGLRPGRDRHPAGGFRRARAVHRRAPGAPRQASCRWPPRCRPSWSTPSCSAPHRGSSSSTRSRTEAAHPGAGLRGARLHPLHFGHHRQTQGHGAHARRLPGADGQGDLPRLRPPATTTASSG